MNKGKLGQAAAWAAAIAFSALLLGGELYLLQTGHWLLMFAWPALAVVLAGVMLNTTDKLRQTSRL